MKILIVNDDGINGNGLKALVKKLREKHEITVVVPDSERSAASHSYSFKYPLFLEKTDKPGFEGVDAYVTNGTPADCVYLGLQNIRNNDIDLVISGINAGANLGTDIPASGTVAAALEGVMLGVPSLAVSQEIKKLVSFENYDPYYEFAADFTADFIEKEDMSGFKDHVISINFPCADRKDIKGIRVCPIGISKNDFFYHAQNDFVGRTHYWVDVNRTPKEYNKEHRTDDYYLDEKYIVFTPIKYDMTAHEHLCAYAKKYNEDFDV